MIRSLTSDRVISINPYEGNTLYPVTLLKVRTDKDMVLLIDKERFGDIEVGDQINIHLEVVK